MNFHYTNKESVNIVQILKTASRHFQKGWKKFYYWITFY